MDFGKIEIICRPCQKCRNAREMLVKAIRLLENEHKTHYPHTIEINVDLRRCERYGANVAKAPFIIIRNKLVMAGRIRDVNVVRHVLLNFIQTGDFIA